MFVIKKNWWLVKKELSYQSRSKFIFGIVFVFIALCIVNFNFLYNDTIQSYEIYKTTEQRMIEQGFNLEEELQKTPRVDTNNGVEEIENVLAYDYLNFQSSIVTFDSNRVLNNTFGWLSFVYFPFIFSIYGVYIATYDYKYKTLKQKLVHSSFGSLYISKILSTIIFCASNILFITAFSYLIHSIYLRLIRNNIPLEEFPIENSSYSFSNFKILLFVFLLTLFFALIGMSIGFLAKTTTVPSIIIVAVNFAVPIFFKYDFRNLLANFGHEIFVFNSNFSLLPPIHVPLLQAGTLLIIFLVLIATIGYVVSNKQSKYTFS